MSDDDETRDHFAPLLRMRRRWLGRVSWCVSHALAFVIGALGFVALIALGGVIVGVAFKLGVPRITSSEEDVELMKESVPDALRVLLASSVVLLVASLALGQLLKRVAPHLPPPAVESAGGPSLRETRRQFRQRVRRENSRLSVVGSILVPLAGAGAMAVLFPSAVPWEGGISLLARAARVLGVLVLGAVALLFVFAALLFLLVFVLFAGMVRDIFASHYLAAHVPAHEDTAERVTAPPLPPPSTREPSPSLLVYLFADRLLRSDTAFKLGAPVPCSNREVRMTDLAATSLAAAFWSLAQRDALRLTSTTRRRLLLFRKTRVEVERLRSERLPGLEGRLMEVPSEDPDAYVDEDTTGWPGPLGDVRAVVQSWLSGGREDPEWAVVSELVDEAKALGIVEMDGDKATVRCADVAAAEPGFAAFEAGWRRFGAREPAMRALLLRECGKAIAGSRVYPETEGPIRTALAWLFRAHSRATRPWPRSPVVEDPPVAVSEPDA